jgi:hypothetical protein
VSSGVGIATGLSTSAAAGILGALLVPPFLELRRLFFVLNAGLAFGALCLTAPFRVGLRGAVTGPPGTGGSIGAVTTAAAMVLILAYIAALYLPGGPEGRGMLALAAAAALSAAAADGWSAARIGEDGWVYALNAVAAAALLGTVIVAMILGHWYLVRRRLEVRHLVRFALLFAGATGVRAVLLAGAVLFTGVVSPRGLGGHLVDLTIHLGFFFWTRVLFGLVGPAVFAFMVYETARIRSTQSATGILYVAVLFVVIGEFLARYLTLAGAGPL